MKNPNQPSGWGCPLVSGTMPRTFRAEDLVFHCCHQFSNCHHCHGVNHPAASAFSAESHTHSHTQVSLNCQKIDNNDEGKQLPETTPTSLFRTKLHPCVPFSHFCSFSAVDVQLRDPRWAACTLMIRWESKFNVGTSSLITNHGENVPGLFVCLFLRFYDRRWSELEMAVRLGFGCL